MVADLFASMVCRGCGKTAQAPRDTELREVIDLRQDGEVFAARNAAGWTVISCDGVAEEYCPACIARLRAALKTAHTQVRIAPGTDAAPKTTPSFLSRFLRIFARRPKGRSA